MNKKMGEEKVPVEYNNQDEFISLNNQANLFSN